MSRRDRIVEVGRALATEARAENVTFLAGSLAYHAFVSMLPLFVLLLVVAATVGQTTLEEVLLSVARAVLDPGGDATTTSLFVREVRQSADAGGLSLLGAAVLVWGTLRLFRGLDTAFSDIYETEAENTFLDQLVDGVVVFVALAGVVVGAAFLHQLFPTGPTVGAVAGRSVALAVVVGLALFPMYYRFPDAGVGVVEVLPGTAFAAVGLVALEGLFRLYVELGSRSPESSVVAGIVVLLTWLYASGLVVLLGVVLNAVLANRSADVDVDPVLGDAASPDRPDRDSVTGALDAIEANLAAAESVAVVCDGERVELPPPAEVARDDGTGPFDLGDAPSLTMRWSVRDGDPNSGSAKAVAAGTEVDDDDVAADGDGSIATDDEAFDSDSVADDAI